MNYATISIDRREAYYERCASLIAKDALGFYTRAEHGRKLQAAIKKTDLKVWDAVALAEHWRGCTVVPLRRKAGEAS